MRLNTPVTQNEHDISDSDSIVSTTDLQGNITYANPYFIEVSGFTEDELIGAPQNIVRHPDMPVEAFADLWGTIKSGLPWTGVVKNRCKNGDYYWVYANVTPVIENGKATGYMSVRTKPSVAQIRQAEQLYKELKDGNPNRLQLRQGSVVKSDFLTKFNALMSFSISQRIAINVGLLMLAIGCLIANMLLSQAKPFLSNTNMAVILGLAFVNTVYLWYSFQIAVVRPSQQALSAAKIMAGGDLTAKIETNRTDELGQVLRMLRQVKVNLHSIVGDVRKNSEHIRVATQEIAAGNMELSGRTESQASSLEETAASMEEFASTVSQNTDNANIASTMAHDALRIADQGGTVTKQMVETMEDINLFSKRMIDITGIIEGIAFQTNILALNAAVEAARAGEQGRGFAVVASEVRSLAQRSAAAAKEIKQLIDTSVEKIHAGTNLTAQAGNAMKEILGSTNKVSGIMNEIASASREQSTGIIQVNEAITLMDTVTQQNAALVEEAAAAAGSLSLQTQTLVKALSVFKLEHGAQHSPVQINVAQSRRAAALSQRTPTSRALLT